MASSVLQQDEHKHDDDDNKNNAMYFQITSERRKRFQFLLDKINIFNDLNFKIAKSAETTYIIDNDPNKTFSIQCTVKWSKPFPKEPTVWYLETIVPGSADNFMKYWEESKYRLQWDTQISSHQKAMISKDDTSEMYVLNSQTKPAVGGIISPRQFNNLIQVWKLNNGVDIELASSGIEYKDFPDKKGFITGFTTLYGQKICRIDQKETNEVYNVPKLMISDKDNEDKIIPLEWCTIQYVVQLDIKGWLPTSVVELGIHGGLIDSYAQCRLYLLQNVFGLNVKVTK